MLGGLRAESGRGQRAPVQLVQRLVWQCCWPARPQIWGRSLRQAQLDYAEIAQAISGYEPVTTSDEK